MFLLHFSRFKMFLFYGHSKIKVCSCVLCVYAGTPLQIVMTVNYQLYYTNHNDCITSSVIQIIISLYYKEHNFLHFMQMANFNECASPDLSYMGCLCNTKTRNNWVLWHNEILQVTRVCTVYKMETYDPFKYIIDHPDLNI